MQCKKTVIIFCLLMTSSICHPQCISKSNKLKKFIGEDNQSFVQYLEKKASNYNCAEIEERPFYVSGVKYMVNKRKYYRVYFEESWAVTAPNAYKRNCSSYEGFLTAKIVRIEVIKRGDMVEVIE